MKKRVLSAVVVAMFVAGSACAIPTILPSITFVENGDVEVTATWSGWTENGFSTLPGSGSSTLAGQQIAVLVPVDLGFDYGAIVQGSVVVTDPGGTDISDLVMMMYSPNTRAMTVTFTSDEHPGWNGFPLPPIKATIVETGGLDWATVTVSGSGGRQMFDLGVQSVVDSVPDGGATLILLGAAFSGLVGVRRHRK